MLNPLPATPLASGVGALNPLPASPLASGVGALLYCPANRSSLPNTVLAGKIPAPYSLCLCLEDTIADSALETAQTICVDTIGQFSRQKEGLTFFPKIYLRVRSVPQLFTMVEKLGADFSLVEGIVLPKITPSSLEAYLKALDKLSPTGKLAILPILESHAMVDLRHRHQFLYQIKDLLAPVSSQVASIRVGGADLCHCFGLRRSVHQSIHNIPVISALFADIIAVFAMEYSVSAPVWEYYQGAGWDTGLLAEASQERGAGFMGKTVIHPRQIPLVNQVYQVSQEDYDDAYAIVHHPPTETLVLPNSTGTRMNEINTHSRWAERILALAQVYGIASAPV